MEPGARGRSPASQRVTQKLGGDTTVRIPYRPRKDAVYARKTAAADLDPATATRQADSRADPKHPAAADALSLSGTTPPSSPTMASFPGGPKSMTPDLLRKGRPQLVLLDSQGKVAAKDGADASFRRHNRGIGSIDSLLSSTTCVNTQSECSRPESRLSREIRSEIEEDADGGLSVLPPRMPRRQASKIQLAPPSVTAPKSSASVETEDQGTADDEEARLVDEISSWVLRNTFGKDVDDCAAPLLVWDCTYRYLQELWTAAYEGKLGFIQTTSGHGTPSSHYGGTPSSSNNDQQHSAQHGKGKRKADGGSDDGSGLGGRDNQGNEERDVSPASQAYSTKGNITNFSCPYRKRNPLRFNVRDYYVCATHSFADMSQLKKHIRAHHPPVQRNAGPFLCPRCCQGFVSKNDLDSHLRQLDVCRITYDSGGADPEDGITQKIISSLEARSLKAKIDNWVSLWKLLFPSDQVIPDPVFVPVMEIFDFIVESKKVISTLKDLLEIQYRYVLEGASQVMDVELKIHQGLERSAKTIYNWIETVVQDWEQRISGTVSLFSSSAISQPDASSDRWASTPHLPPSPAPTPTVLPGNAAAASILPGADSPGATAPGGLRTSSVRRRPNPPPKRIKRPEILPKAPPPTQIPLPIQRARTPQSQARIVSASFRPAPTVLPSQSVPIPTQTTQNLEPGPPYQASWEHPTVTVTSAYSAPYTSPGDVFQHPAMTPTHYAHIHPAYLPSTEPPNETISAEEMQQHELDQRQQSAATIHANRLTMSTASRSSLASLSWIRDENRDSSQTLVEAHPPGRCGSMYCPSCSKTLPDDITAQPSPVGMHAVTGGHHHHPGFHTAGPGTGAPFQTSHRAGEVHGFGDQVEWSFHTTGGVQGTGTNDNNLFGGGPQGPQEGY